MTIHDYSVWCYIYFFVGFVMADHVLLIIGIIILIVIVQLVALGIKRYHKNRFQSSFAAIADARDSDQYIEYYKKAQMIDIYRTIISWILIIIVMRFTDSNVVQVMAIAAWAIILAFQSVIIAFVMYLMLLSHYKVWDTVKIGSLGEGEIISIKPLHLWLAGRNKAWEHTWEFIMIPNNKVWENPIAKVDYHLNAYQKIVCTTYYRANDRYSFDQYIEALHSFLDKLLPIRSAKNVWHYKSYIWHKYKLNYDMKESGVIEVWVWFIARQRDSDRLKHQIYSFIQSNWSGKD